MDLKYCLISLINFLFGVFVSSIVNYLQNKKMFKINKISDFFINNETELFKYNKSLTYHFFRTAKLLNNISREYENLYKYMSKSSNELLLNNDKNNDSSFDKSVDKDSVVNIPRDYSDDI